MDTIRLIASDLDATLLDGQSQLPPDFAETVRALAELLPLTLEMSAMPHEKYCYLSQELPVSTESPGTIAAGDVMLWGNSCLVIFYESFQTSYSYTRIGRIVDTDGLADALGQGGVTVTLRKAG